MHFDHSNNEQKLTIVIDDDRYEIHGIDAYSATVVAKAIKQARAFGQREIHDVVKRHMAITAPAKGVQQ